MKKTALTLALAFVAVTSAGVYTMKTQAETPNTPEVHSCGDGKTCEHSNCPTDCGCGCKGKVENPTGCGH
jgi:hypothetical protein